MDYRKTEVRGPEMRLLVLGPSRVGKSSLGNLLLDRQAFDTRGGQGTAVAWGEVSGRRLLVVDTYGWRSREEEKDEEKSVNSEGGEKEDKGRRRRVPKNEKLELLGALNLCDPGPHALLLVHPLLPFSQRESAALQARMELLPPGAWNHTVLVFTLGDKLAAGRACNLQHYLEGAGEQLQWLLGACRYRCHVVNNKDTEDRGQVTRLLEKLEDWVMENGGWHFSLVMYCRMEEEWRRREKEAQDRWEREQERQRQERHHGTSLMDMCLSTNAVSRYSGRLEPKSPALKPVCQG